MKMYKKHGAGICLWSICLFLLFTGITYAGQEDIKQDEEGRIEQVYINLPEIAVYTEGIPVSAGEFSAYLGSEKLTLEKVQPFKDSGQGIYYFVLLDISDSIPDGYFSQIKEGIVEFYQAMGENDRLFLYTFGENVKRELDGTQSSEEVWEIISGLENRDRKTSLFEAIHMAAKDAKQISPAQNKRPIIAVISDGEDVTIGKKTGVEALKILDETGIPVYAFGIRDTKREHLNQFGELARMSGGKIKIFGREDGTEILIGLKKQLQDSEVLHLKTQNNLASNSSEHFLISFPDGSDYTKEVLCNRWIEDRTAPELIEVYQEGAKNLHLTFSEAVAGAGEPQSYRIVRIRQVGLKDANSALEIIGKFKNGPSYEEVPVAIASISKENDTNYLLNMTENLVIGEYRIDFPGITDVSMEKNPMASSGNLLVKTEIPKDAEHKTWIERLKGAFDNWLWRLLLLSVAAGLIGFAVYFRKLQNNIMGTGKRNLASGDKAWREDETGAMNGIDGHPEPESELLIILTDSGGIEYHAIIKRERCILGGRGSICELHFKDIGMSRKHFSLEWDGKQVFVSDLHTTNGTQVNGGVVKGKQILKVGDIIMAGSTFLTVRW